MNLLVRSFLTAVVPLVLFACLIAVLLRTVVLPAVETSVYQMAQEKQRTTRAQVTDFLQSRRKILESIARRDLLTEGPTPSALSYLKAEQKELTDLFEGLYYNELTGVVTPADGPRFQVADRPYFQAVKEGEAVVGEVLTSRATGQRILLMVVPIHKEGKLVAALGGTILVSELFRSIAPTPEKFELQVALLQDQTVLEGFPAAAEVIGKTAAFSAHGYRITTGVEDSLRAWACELPQVPWLLVVAWPEKEMLSPLHQTRWATLTSFFVIFLIAAWFSLRWQNSVARPLHRAAETLEQYQGDKQLHLLPEGPRELSLMIESINDMSNRVSHEMSRRLELEQQLAKAVHQERLGTMADSIAHDFNNVLSAIINLTEFCLEEAKRDSQVRDDLETILQSARLGVGMVKQLRQKAMSAEHPIEVLNFDSEFEGWEETFRSLLPPGISLQTELSAGETYTRAVAHHLFQILLNLICNARDVLSAQESGLITVCSRTQEDKLLIEVRDNGPGVPPEMAERIFEPFFTTRGEEGSGLGLSTCHRLVKSMNAEIELVVGESTCFRIILPVAQTSAES